MKKYLIIAAVAAAVIYAHNNFAFVRNALRQRGTPAI